MTPVMTVFLRLMTASLTLWCLSMLQGVEVRAQGRADVERDQAARRAVDYLVREVPRWRREHPCYSCHHNGDGARALAVAAGRGLLDVQQFADAASWLRVPSRWDGNSREGGVTDQSLSRIQFSAALQALIDARGAGRQALEQAAALVVADQRVDGSWGISVTSNVGTPAGYGSPLATAVARGVLRRVSSDQARAAVARADGWFRRFTPEAVLEASAALLGLDAASDEAARGVRQRALGILERGQGQDGGWGPYTNAPSEPFDTAVALLALRVIQEDVSLAQPVLTDAARLAAITRGEAYLVAQQQPDGSWPETTRPSGQESYSQRVSTTAWALLALLAR
jgi:squalene cyclase